MKKMWFVLCALLLVPTLALANNDMVSVSELRQQVEAMGRWTKTYEAYGRTIEVDVPIIVPEVEKMPIVMIEPWRPYDEESWLPHQKIVEIQELGGDDNPIFLRCGDVGLYSYLNPNSEQERTTRFYRFKYPKDDAENRTSQDYIQVRFNSASVMLNANGKELERTGKSYDYREMDSEMCYAEDSNVSVGGAEKCLRDILTYYYGEEGSDIEIDYVRVLDRGRDKKGNVYDQNPMGSYYFHFWQNICGIPLMNDAGSIYKVIVRSDSLISELDRIALINWNWAEIMSRSDSYEIFATLVQPAQAMFDDVPLLSLEKIIQNIEKYIRKEYRQKGYIHNIYSLRLGYVCYLSDEETEGFVAYPMWRVECDYIKPGGVGYQVNAMSDDYRNGFDFTDLYVNAQTGEVITDKLTRIAQEVCPRVITWEDAQ